MKKKQIIIVLILCAVCIAACITGVEISKRIISEASNAGVMGQYMYTTNGSHMIIMNNTGPCTMSADDESIFDGLTNGDVISVICGPVMETYPGRVEVYSVDFIREGTLDDIDKATLDSLAEMGWHPAE